MLRVGEKYIVRATNRNFTNGLIAGKEARIAHLSHDMVSVRIFQNGGEKRLAVPKDIFGVNFEEEMSFVPPNQAYASAAPFLEPYL